MMFKYFHISTFMCMYIFLIVYGPINLLQRTIIYFVLDLGLRVAMVSGCHWRRHGADAMTSSGATGVMAGLARCQLADIEWSLSRRIISLLLCVYCSDIVYKMCSCMAIKLLFGLIWIFLTWSGYSTGTQASFMWSSVVYGISTRPPSDVYLDELL